MGGKYSRDWELIDEYTDRLAVPGGWLVRSQLCVREGSNTAYSQSMVFVNDPQDDWALEPEE